MLKSLHKPLIISSLLSGMAWMQIHAQRAQSESLTEEWLDHRLHALTQQHIEDETRIAPTFDSLYHYVEKRKESNKRHWIKYAEANQLIHHQRYSQALLILNELIDEHLSDRTLQMKVTLALRNIHDNIRAYDEAISYHQLIDWDYLQDEPEHERPNDFLAFNFYKMGLYDEAIPSLKRSIAHYHDVGDAYFEVSYTNSLGLFYEKRGDLDSALACFDEARALLEMNYPNGAGLRRTEYQFILGLIDGNVGQVLAQQGKHLEAIPLLKSDIRSSLDPKASISYRSNGVASLLKLAKSYLATNQFDEAASSLNRAETLIKASDDYRLKTELLERKALLSKEKGSFQEAYELLDSLQHIKDSVFLAQQVGSTHGLLDLYSGSYKADIRKKSDIISRLEMLNAQERQRNRTFGLLIGIAVLASIFSSVLFFLDRNRRRAMERINEEMERQKAITEQSLKDQETLLKEVNHRVKNNLQVVSSLLYLQRRKIEHPQDVLIIKDIEHRLQTMALIHQKLYQDDASAEGFGSFISDLVDDIIRSFKTDDLQITPTIEVEDLSIPLNIAIPLGYIIHELLTNSIKHAFGEVLEGQIFLELVMLEGSKACIRYSDNGAGISKEGWMSEDSESIGSQLILMMTRQIQGDFRTTSWRPLSVEICFPIR